MILRNTFKKKLLLFLATGADFWHENFSYTSYKHPYLVKQKKDSFQNLTSRLTTIGEIEKIVKEGEVYLRLTSKGFDKLKQDIPLYKFSSQSWDGYWRMVIFDIPELERSIRVGLRRKLVDLGLGQWQKSIYITPFNLEEEINEYLKSNELFGLCFCLKAKRLGSGDDRKIANQAFGLDKLNEAYANFLDERIEEFKILNKENKLNTSDIEAVTEEYFDLILKDPGLPQELLPKPWFANETRKEFKDFINSLTLK